MYILFIKSGGKHSCQYRTIHIVSCVKSSVSYRHIVSAHESYDMVSYRIVKSYESYDT